VRTRRVARETADEPARPADRGGNVDRDQIAFFRICDFGISDDRVKGHSAVIEFSRALLWAQSHQHRIAGYRHEMAEAENRQCCVRLGVDGVAVQMERPLVLHVTSKIADPLPFLRGQELLKQISGCNVKLVSEVPKSGHVMPTSIAVKSHI
jgi:hypothetical protein